MPDEIEEVVEEPIEEPIEEPAKEPTEETPEFWKDVAPELADSYAEMSPKAREEYLAKKLTATRAEEAPPKEGEPTNSSQPPVTQVPDVDLDQLDLDAKEAFESGDSEKFAKCEQTKTGFIRSLVGIVQSVVQDSEARVSALQSQVDQMVIPNELRSIQGVPDVTDADIATAADYLRTGEVKSQESALKLAVANRKLATAVPDTDAQRRAAAQRAAKQGGTSRSPGAVNNNSIPADFSGEEARSLLVQLAEEKKT